MKTRPALILTSSASKIGSALRSKRRWARSLIIILFIILPSGANALEVPPFSKGAGNPPKGWVGGIDDKFVNNLIRVYLNKEEVCHFPQDITLEEAKEIQARLIGELEKTLGKPIGYKAALTNPDAQKAFGVNEPIRGVLLEGMLVKSRAVLPSKFGAHPMLEADLIVRVKDDSINDANTPEDVINSIDAIIPFIELPDMMFTKDVKPTAPAIIAINVGARYGVLGQEIEVRAKDDWAKRISEINVTIVDEKGNALAQGQTAALMGNPLNVVLWIRDSLLKEGNALKKGDLLSLGSITKMLPVEPNSTIRAIYTGITSDAIEVAVSFKDPPHLIPLPAGERN